MKTRNANNSDTEPSGAHVRSEREAIDSSNRTILFQNIIQQATDAIITIDEQQRIIIFNNAAEVMFGYTERDLLGGSIDKLIPKRYRTDHRHYVTEFGKTGTTTRKMGDLGTIFGRRADGEEFPIEASIARSDHNGRKYYTVILRDTTNRIRTEKELEQSKESYFGLFNTIGNAVIVLNEYGEILDANASTGTMFGYTHDDLVGMSWTSFHLDQNGSSDPLHTRLIAAFRGEAQSFEWVFQSKSGNPLTTDVLLSKGIYFGRDVVIATIHDITDLKKKEDQIRIFEQIIDNINESVTLFDTDGTVLFVNNAFCETYGYVRNEVTGKDIRSLISARVKDGVIRNIIAATMRGGWTGEIVTVKNDTSEIPVSLSTSVIRDDAGAPSMLIGVARDISRRKILEEHLIQNQKIQGIAVLVEGIAHNFNNILAIIVGYASISRRENLSKDKLFENLEVILHAAERGANLVKQMFSFGYKGPVEFAPIEVNTLIGDTLQLASDTFPKTYTFFYSYDPENPHIYGDRAQLRQALLNILFNARDAMPNGGTIRIGTQSIEDAYFLKSDLLATRENKYIGISIADSGTGMDAETKKKIFDPFFTTKDVDKGVGLGLTVAYGIIRNHNGYIDVESEVGKGTTLTLYLSKVTPEKDEESDLESPGKHRPALQTILVVEDDEYLRILMQWEMEVLGIRVLTAGDGRAAEQVFQRHKEEIQAVIMDVGLPKQSGYDTARAIRTIDPDIPIIILTGYDTEDVRKKFEGIRIDNIMQKPCRTIDIMEELQYNRLIF
jgi:two-component system, cell cycle sensor histidine kinase and response regulator CckA